MSRLAAAVDRVVMNASLLGRSNSAADQLSLTERMARIDELVTRYHRPEWLGEPDAFFGPPREVHPTTRERTRWGRTSVSMRWPSEYRTLVDDVQEGYDAFTHNTTVHARWYRSPTPRPTAIVIHGYGGGEFRFESRVFPVRRWLKSGLDVVLFALPFHGPRRAPRDKVRFPSALPSVTIEGFRQAVCDLRALTSLLLDRGVPQVGVIGMSLGGYTSALLATAEPRLAFAMPYIPLGSLADYAADRGRLLGSPEQQRTQRDGLEQIYAVVSPVGRPPAVPPERVLVAGGKGDRITPIRHAERIADHFGCELVRFDGGHLIQHGRRKAWEALDARLRRLGVL